MAQDNANPIKSTSEQGNPAKSVASKLQKQVEKPDALPSQTDDFAKIARKELLGIVTNVSVLT